MTSEPHVLSGLMRALLALNAVASLAAAAVLALAPAAIPGLVGVTVEPPQVFVVHLLAAAELAVGALCALALRSREPAAARQAALVLIVLHVASAAAGVAARLDGASGLVLWNAAARLAIAAGLAWSLASGSRRPG